MTAKKKKEESLCSFEYFINLKLKKKLKITLYLNLYKNGGCRELKLNFLEVLSVT